MRIDSGGYCRELLAAGLPIHTVRADGSEKWYRVLTPTEQAQVDAIRTAHDPDADAKEAEALRLEIRGLWERWDSLTAAELKRCVKHLMQGAFAAEIQQ